MKKSVNKPQLIVVLSLAMSVITPSLAFANSRIQEMASATSIEKAIKENTLRPIPSTSWSNFDERKAYVVQKRLVASLLKSGEKISGFKAGLTSAGAPQRFSLTQPISGVLFQSAQLQDFKKLSLTGSHRLMIEQEVAFLLSVDIHQKIPDVASLKGHFSHVSWALEFPDLGFLSRPNGLDIIANNVVNRYYVVGDWQKIPENMNKLEVTLRCEGKTVTQGLSKNVMGDQWQALLWMVNQRYAQGYPIKKGQVFLTGSISEVVPATLCRYQADFSSLGRIEFTIEP